MEIGKEFSHYGLSDHFPPIGENPSSLFSPDRPKLFFLLLLLLMLLFFLRGGKDRGDVRSRNETKD
jgi:hypothetical protein